MQGKAFGADRLQRAVSFHVDEAVIKSPAHGAGFLVVDVTADLLGDSGRIFAEDRSNAFERSPFIEFRLNGDSVFKDQVFIFLHNEFLQSMKKELGKLPCLYSRRIHWNSERVNSTWKKREIGKSKFHSKVEFSFSNEGISKKGQLKK